MAEISLKFSIEESVLNCDSSLLLAIAYPDNNPCHCILSFKSFIPPDVEREEMLLNLNRKRGAPNKNIYRRIDQMRRNG